MVTLKLISSKVVMSRLKITMENMKDIWLLKKDMVKEQ